MGLTMSEAPRLFVYQSIAEDGLTFRVNTPNAVTAVTLQFFQLLERLHLQR